MESFSTRECPASRKISYWNEVSSDVFACMEVEPFDASRFEGSIERERIGPLSLMRVTSSAVRIRHTRAHIARSSVASYLLLAPCNGEIRLTTSRVTDVAINSGDICLIDHSQPYELRHGDATGAVCLDIPAHWLAAWLPNPEKLIGLVIPPERLASRVLVNLLQALAGELRFGANAMHSGLGHGLLGFVAAAFDANDGCRAGRDSMARAMLYRAHIDSLLPDQALAPTTVAKHFGISERQLRAVLGSTGETFSAYVLRRRLERAALLLGDPAWKEKTILEIALSMGFANPTHFACVFKGRYGLTPREYRLRPVAHGRDD